MTNRQTFPASILKTLPEPIEEARQEERLRAALADIAASDDIQGGAEQSAGITVVSDRGAGSTGRGITDKDLIREIAMDIGKATVEHIELAYPAALEAVAKTARQSIRNTVHNEIMAALTTVDADAIRARLVERRKDRRRRLAIYRKLRGDARPPADARCIEISEGMLEAGMWAISPFVSADMTKADRAEMLRQSYHAMRSAEASEESDLSPDEQWEAI